MGLFDKLKNIFIEEEMVEDDSSVQNSDGKTLTKDEIFDEEKTDTNVFVTDLPKVDDISDRSLVDTKDNFKFPIIFEDDDFKKKKKKSKSINVLERENNKYEPEI